MSVKTEFYDKLTKEEFFAYRRRGVEPSQIPSEVAEKSVKVVLEASDEEMFKVEKLSDFTFRRPRSIFKTAKCSKCGEYVFERYLRIVDGEKVCIPCSKYEGEYVVNTIFDMWK
ncbi:MAG: hypothetical protein HA494_01675 [Thaumarchaeota archaeon]|nr:hypothetical protein [Nitrososphaerota archaeon]